VGSSGLAVNVIDTITQFAMSIFVTLVFRSESFPNQGPFFKNVNEVDQSRCFVCLLCEDAFCRVRP